MKYRSGYKYQLAETEVFQTEIYPEFNVITQYLIMNTSGLLTIKKGYAWDGPSGPVIDRKTNLRASLAHDGLYQLMRSGGLSHSLWRSADKEFAKILRSDGAWEITIKVDMLGLKIANGAAALPKNRKKIHTAP